MQTSDINEIARTNTAASIATGSKFLRRVERMGRVRSSIDPKYLPNPAESIHERDVSGQRRRAVLSITRPDGSEVLTIYA